MADKDEPVWWAGVEAGAVAAFDFWHVFFDLRRGPNDTDPLSSGDVDAFRRIIRAVSWVESQHGHGGGSSAVDPVQCGNPGDSWWQTLTGQSGNGDRFVRGPNQTVNYWAKELPGAAAADVTFPAAAQVASLNSPNDGHNDANFGAVMSFYWGIPYLVHRTNTGAGDKTYQCGDCSEQRLIDGAVAYNGGGDPNYRTKIVAALDLIDHPVTSILARALEPARAESIFSSLLTTLAGASAAKGDRLLFPNGITSLAFEVEIAGSKVKLEIKGPPTPVESSFAPGDAKT